MAHHPNPNQASQLNIAHLFTLRAVANKHLCSTPSNGALSSFHRNNHHVRNIWGNTPPNHSLTTEYRNKGNRSPKNSCSAPPTENSGLQHDESGIPFYLLSTAVPLAHQHAATAATKLEYPAQGITPKAVGGRLAQSLPPGASPHQRRGQHAYCPHMACAQGNNPPAPVHPPLRLRPKKRYQGAAVATGRPPSPASHHCLAVQP